MRDWSETVHRRLASLRVGHAREAEIRAEFAGHLEEAYDDAVRRGYREQDAVAWAMAQVPDWADLAMEGVLRDARAEEKGAAEALKK